MRVERLTLPKTFAHVRIAIRSCLYEKSLLV